MFSDGNRFRRDGRDSPDGGLTLAPMIDVVFLLLIFFMVSTTFVLRPGLQLELPTSETTADVPSERWTITVTPEGSFYLNQEESSLEAIRNRLEQDPKPTTVRADRTLPHGLIVDVLDAVQQAGVEAVNISTREPAGE